MRRVYLPAERDGTSAHYCPSCWGLEIYGADGSSHATASQAFQKTLSELPPGFKITGLVIGGKEIRFDEPVVVKGAEDEE